MAKVFQSTPSVWRETIIKPLVIAARIISIHSLRVEGDYLREKYSLDVDISIHSLRVEGDGHLHADSHAGQHFNPLPPCGGRPDADITHCKECISIHSLRVEGDSKIAQLSA